MTEIYICIYSIFFFDAPTLSAFQLKDISTQDERRGDDILIRGISKWKVHLSFSFTRWKHLRSWRGAWGSSELRLGCNCTEDGRQLCLIHPAVIQWGGGPHMCLRVCLCVSDVIVGGWISQCGSSQRHSSELQFMSVCVCSRRAVLAPCTAFVNICLWTGTCMRVNQWYSVWARGRRKHAKPNEAMR